MSTRENIHLIARTPYLWSEFIFLSESTHLDICPVFQVEASLKAVEEERIVLHNKFLIETESRKEMEGECVIRATQIS